MLPVQISFTCLLYLQHVMSQLVASTDHAEQEEYTLECRQ